jgi:predicted aspartyl protease/Tfp pilus assembly protein PilF
MVPSRLRVVVITTAALLALSVGLRADRDGLAAHVQLQLATLLFDDARFTEAAQAFERARDLAPHADVRFAAGRGLVRSLLRVAEVRRARVEAAWLAEAFPRRAEALALDGEAMWAAGMFDLAETRFRQGLDLDAGDPRALSGLARALAGHGQLDEALDAATAAVTRAPSEGEYHHALGAVLERLRRFEESAAAYANYVNLLPNKDRSDKAVWARQHIRFLRSFGSRAPFAMSEAVGATVHTVPFRLVRDKVIVAGRVNGSRPMDFVLDTGAEMTIVSQRTAEREGVVPLVYTLSAGVGQMGLRGLQVGRTDTLEIGTLKIENVPTLIKNPPLKDLPTREIESFSPPALGLSMSIDYRRRVLIMAKQLPDTPADVELPLRMHRLVMVRGLINDRNPVHFVVDTGGEVISISRSTLESINVEPPRRIPLKVYGTSGWDPEAFLLTGLNLQFDRVKLSNHAVVVLNLDAPSALLGFELGGIVGHKFLSRYEVGIDLARSRLRLRTL